MYKDYAYRSVTATIRNASARTIRLMPIRPFDWGQWQDGKAPTDIGVIPPNGYARFVVESARYLTGCEGSLSYSVDDGRRWEIYWNNPYIGHNTYRQTLDGVPDGDPENNDEQDDDRAQVYYAFIDDMPPPKASVVVPPPPAEQGGGAKGDAEHHFSVAAGACALQSPGWTVFHEVEGDGNKQDRFRTQTCDLVSGTSAIFFPSSLNPYSQIRVLVFFVATQSDLDLPDHAARYAAENAGWVLVGVDGKRNIDSLANPAIVTAEDICRSLEYHGYKRAIDCLRLACHSRSSFNMVAALKAKTLVADGAERDVVDMSKLDCIVSFDSDRTCDLWKSLGGLIKDTSIVFGFRATVAAPYDATYNPTGPRPGEREGWSMPPQNTVELSKDKLIRDGLEGIVRLRRLAALRYLGNTISDDFTKLLDGWAEPGDATPEVSMARGAELPPLGGLSSSNIAEYCGRKQDVLAKAVKSGALGVLTQSYRHQMFVAEFVAEAMSATKPKIG